MVLPDIVEAILFRCVANDLLRSKSVCKSWYSLISSPYFVKTHAKFMCNKREGRKIAMINADFPESEELPELEDSSASEYDSDENLARLQYVSPHDEWENYRCWNILGSSNGLVLFSGPRLCVTNPVTREFREVTQPSRLEPIERRCYGFGYDSSTDDYKVFMAVQYPDKSFVSILSLKSNTWNISAGQVNYKFHNLWPVTPGLLLNGALHWFWYDANQNPLIVSFDIAKEEFIEIPQPNDTRYVWNMNCTLGIMNGRLCIYPFYDNEEQFPSCGTWVMKNYHHINPSWELLSVDSEMNNHAIHHILNNDTSQSKIMPVYSCDKNIEVSRSKEYMTFPIFVQTLVSPFVNNNNDGGPSHAKG